MAPVSRHSRRRARSLYAMWLAGVVLGFAVVAATLYLFSSPALGWILAGMGLLLLAIAWEGMGAILLTLGLAVGINWTVKSGLNVVLELLITSLLSILIAGAVAMLVAEARRQMQIAFESPQHRLIMLGTSGIGAGVGCLIGVIISTLI